MDNWLIELKGHIIDKRDAENFDDIISCYQNGLLRAGFLMAWLMLIESLKRKIVELADKEVKVAVNELKSITSVEDAMHSNDEVIWKTALKCELITNEDDSVLEILYKEKIEGYQFADQGDFIDMLKSMDENDISEFTPKQLQKIGKYVEMCCVGGTFKAQNFATTHSIWSENLDYAKGFAIEGMSNDKGQLYVAKRHMEYVLPVLYHTKEENLPDIIKAVDELPVYETMSERMICSNIRLQVRKYFDEESEAYKNLIAVVNKYCKA